MMLMNRIGGTTHNSLQQIKGFKPLKENAITTPKHVQEQQKQYLQQFMTSTHQYYNAQNFWSKAQEASPTAAEGLSQCMDDSFNDLLDNDTSERHIVVQVETTPKKADKPVHQPTSQSQSLGSGPNKSAQSKLNNVIIANKQKPQAAFKDSTNTTYSSQIHANQSASLKYSVAMPVPSNETVTPGQKSAKSNGKHQQYIKEGAVPKQLHFIHRINEQETDNSVSTNPSNSGLDLLPHQPQSKQSRQQKFLLGNQRNLQQQFRTLEPKDKPITKLEMMASQQLSGDVSNFKSLMALQSVEEFIQHSNRCDFLSKMDDFVQRKEEKLRRMRKEKEKQEVEGCVFSPNIYTRKAGENIQVRDLNQFLSDQQRFVESIRQKQEQMKEEKDQLELALVQRGPYLNQKSRQILMNRQQRTQSRENSGGSNDVRGLNDATSRFLNQANVSSQPSLKKKKTSEGQQIRDRPIAELLYQDAKRRQQSIEARQKEAIAKSHQPVPLVSRESQKLVIQRFEREINAAIYELHYAQRDLKIEEVLLNEDQPFIQLPQTVNYLSMKILMVRLGCCTEVQTFSECPESELLYEMWKFLSQASNQFISGDITDEDLQTDRLKLFAMVILRVAEPRVLQDYLNKNTAQGFNFEEAASLITKFELFYINRLKFLSNQQVLTKKEFETLQTQGLPFKPQLSQTTIQLAQRKQSRHKPGMMLSGNNRQAVMQTFFETKEAQEMRECTFKPFVSDASRKLSSNRRLLPDNQEFANDKCAELFEHAKQVIQDKQSKVDKTTEEVEFEKGKEQCTFRPAIHQIPPIPKASARGNKESIHTPFAQQHYERQIRAREERERVKEITQRGYSSNRPQGSRADSGNARSVKHYTSVGEGSVVSQQQQPQKKEATRRRPGSILGHFKSVASALGAKYNSGTHSSNRSQINSDLRIPLLLVDIGIGDRKERIAVYEGDRADVLAKDFCIRHGLDVNSIAIRLQEEIERQIELISQGNTYSIAAVQDHRIERSKELKEEIVEEEEQN